jgi:tetratricopeptide (TPR) repeat protein
MKLRCVAAALVLALAACMPLSARPQQGPLTRAEIVHMVKNDFGDKTGAKFVGLRGIDFDPTPDFLESLKNAGAADSFIQALTHAKHPVPPAKKPLNQVQLLALLGGQVPSHRVAMLVNERGIDFDPKDDFLNDIIRGGGDPELVQALRTARVIKSTNVDPVAAAKEVEVRQHISRAIEFNQKGQYAQGEQEIRAALQLWPRDPTILIDLASVLQNQGKWDESAEVSREALRVDPGNSSAHASLGLALGTKQDTEGALRELREAVRLDPTNDNAHYNLGVALMITHDSEGAMAQYHEAIRLNPKNDAAHYGLGKRLEFDKHDSRAALEEYRAAYNLVPTNDTYKRNYERLAAESTQ